MDVSLAATLITLADFLSEMSEPGVCIECTGRGKRAQCGSAFLLRHIFKASSSASQSTAIASGNPLQGAFGPGARHYQANCPQVRVKVSCIAIDGSGICLQNLLRGLYCGRILWRSGLQGLLSFQDFQGETHGIAMLRTYVGCPVNDPVVFWPLTQVALYQMSWLFQFGHGRRAHQRSHRGLARSVRSASRPDQEFVGRSGAVIVMLTTSLMDVHDGDRTPKLEAVRERNGSKSPRSETVHAPRGAGEKVRRRCGEGAGRRCPGEGASRWVQGRWG